MMLIAALPCICSLHKYIPPLEEPEKRRQVLRYLRHNSTQQAAEKFQRGSCPRHFTVCIKSEIIEGRGRGLVSAVSVRDAKIQKNIFH